jgi:hypothetical protein
MANRWETLLGCHRNHLIGPLFQRCIVADEKKNHGIASQARSQERRLRYRDCRAAPCQCLLGKTEAEKHNVQKPL